MEQLALSLRRKMEEICDGYFYHRQADIIEKTMPFTEEIQQFLKFFLQGNVFGMEENDYNALFSYASKVAADYVEAATENDAVLMADTLWYGLKELLDIYLSPAEEEHDGDI